MRDLETLIAEWRQQMLAAGINTPVPLKELESHLRDEINQQAKSGLSETEAFTVAVQKMGIAQVLENEFRKVEGIKKARSAKRLEILLLTICSLDALLMGCVFLFKFQGLSALTPGQQISGLGAIAAFTLLIWSGQIKRRTFPLVHARQIRNAIYLFSGVLITLWWLVFFKIILPNHDFAMGQLLVTLLWGLLLPVGAGLAFELRNRNYQRTMMVS